MYESRNEPFRARQNAIVELGLMCSGTHDIQELLDAACRLVADGVGVERWKVLERRASGSLFVRAGWGWPPGFVGALEIPAGGDSQASFALDSGIPVVVTDLATERRFRAHPRFLESGVRSGVNVVIPGPMNAFGVLEADSLSARDYDADDVAFLQSAAHLIGVSIERHIYEEDRDHLLEVASHELRNPLAVVLGQTERLFRRAERSAGVFPADAVESLGEALAGAKRLDSLLEKIFQLGTVESEGSSQSSYVQLDELIRIAVEQATERYPDVTIHSHVAIAAQVPGDEARAQMVLSNLVENAAKYSTIEPSVEVSLQETDGQYEIRVRDRCGGIAGDELGRLFEWHFRGRRADQARGLGLGLYVAYRAASALGWMVDVETTPGEGCEFIVAIRRPVAP
jgi:signal transduction histidine kinase